ncbi:MAG TPA: hypothetical protein ENN65_07865 [Candidatus Hydrogenedentes bacterium]|nr:hypothetical protein [Candidatus Hydrogenedentota bacterium]
MMGGLWMAGMAGAQAMQTTAQVQRDAAARSVAYEARSEANELRHQVERLSLLNQALWELIRERLNVTDTDLEKRAMEIDMRDGIQDNKISARPVRCPTCHRISNSKHFRCLYCGQLFEKPVFG